MISANDKRRVFAEAKSCCEYCRNQQRFSTGRFAIDHIEPLAKKGIDDFENLALACPACNAHKYTKTQAFDFSTRRFVQIFNPRTQSWGEHFSWSEDYSEIIGLTPVGRATISALNMNRPESVNLRRVLYLSGEHPPL